MAINFLNFQFWTLLFVDEASPSDEAWLRSLVH